MSSIIELAVWIGFLIYSVVVLWRIFEKAGKPGWASLIPFYNTYMLLKTVDKPAWWLIPLCVPFVNAFFWYFFAIRLAR